MEEETIEVKVKAGEVGVEVTGEEDGEVVDNTSKAMETEVEAPTTVVVEAG